MEKALSKVRQPSLGTAWEQRQRPQIPTLLPAPSLGQIWICSAGTVHLLCLLHILKELQHCSYCSEAPGELSASDNQKHE